jgi:hypothetical protein
VFSKEVVEALAYLEEVFLSFLAITADAAVVISS